MSKKRKNMLHMYVSDQEEKQIHDRMTETGFASLSAYLRSMALDGYIIHVDLSDIRALTKLLGMCSKNLNQYVRHANETGSIYAADIEDLNERLNEIRADMKTILKQFEKYSKTR